MQRRSFQTDHFPFVAEGGVQLLVEVDGSVVPVQDVEHNAKTIILPSHPSEPGEQRAADALAAELGADVDIFEEEAGAAKRGIAVKEKRVAGGLRVPFSD